MSMSEQSDRDEVPVVQEQRDASVFNKLEKAGKNDLSDSERRTAMTGATRDNTGIDQGVISPARFTDNME